MARSSWKVPNIILSVNKTNTRDNQSEIRDRTAVIVPAFIGQTVHIANGLRFVPIRITERHVGFKFGTFVLTKKRARLKK